ncbi:MAG: hypothetical protein HC789_19285, partial [Microcoleus sp. CSU_2_2]|nr:hypothetical protein [Microcoleus sp. CSU_2_2]
ANDRILADRYYREMLNNRELQRRARSQADAFGAAKRTAEAQIKTLQVQQETAAKLLSDLTDKIAETQEEREQKEQELAVAKARLDGITRIREQTEQTFVQLVSIEKLNLAQAKLEQEIAKKRKAGIDAAVEARMERDALELERQRQETTAKIEQLKQLQAEDELRRSLNNARGGLGLETLEATEDPVQLQTQLAGLLTSLKDLESQQPDLPDDLKALLAEVRGDIHLALQGKEASVVQENLIQAMEGLIGQVQQYKTEINRIDLEEQWDTQLLQIAQQNLQSASKQLLEELQRTEELGGERQVIDPLYLEALNKVAYAEQAVDISEDLAKQSKEILDKIIKQRIEQRKLRKKMFWLKVLGIIRNIIGILGFILKFTPLAPLGIALNLANAGIGIIQSAITGDWAGAIFQGVMAGVGFLASAIPLPPGLTTGIQALMGLAQGSFDGIRSIMSGQGIVGFLQILGGVASAITSGLSSFINSTSDAMKQVVLQVFNSLKTVPLQIYAAIEGIKNGDWVAGIGNILNAIGTLGSNFAGIFNNTAAQVFNVLNDAGSSVKVIGSAIKEGGIEGLLSGINGMLGIWGDDLVKLVDRLKGEPIDPVSLEEASASC